MSEFLRLSKGEDNMIIKLKLNDNESENLKAVKKEIKKFNKYITKQGRKFIRMEVSEVSETYGEKYNIIVLEYSHK